jgi:hypothetical protein
MDTADERLGTRWQYRLRNEIQAEDLDYFPYFGVAVIIGAISRFEAHHMFGEDWQSHWFDSDFTFTLRREVFGRVVTGQERAAILERAWVVAENPDAFEGVSDSPSWRPNLPPGIVHHNGRDYVAAEVLAKAAAVKPPSRVVGPDSSIHGRYSEDTEFTVVWSGGGVERSLDSMAERLTTS